MPRYHRLSRLTVEAIPVCNRNTGKTCLASRRPDTSCDYFLLIVEYLHGGSVAQETEVCLVVQNVDCIVMQTPFMR